MDQPRSPVTVTTRGPGNVASSSPSPAPSVLVACRVRPHVARADGADYWGEPVLGLDLPARSVRTRDPSSGRVLGFGPFDALFGPDSTQEDVFEALGRPMVDAALTGMNATILAYGQTGSGKTHTMQGGARAGGPGLTPRVVEGIFAGIAAAADTWEFMVRVSYCEIYLERVRDLLNPGAMNLTIRQDEERGVYVEGVVEEYVGSAAELLELVRVGEAHRAVGATGMNEASSRSHSILTVQVLARDTITSSARTSRLCLVDLAGSEAVSRTGAEGSTLNEAKTINKSLFTLSLCISTLAAASQAGAKAFARANSRAGGEGEGGGVAGGALSAFEGDGGGTPGRNGGGAGGGGGGGAALGSMQHVPYRDSKLTRLLQDSLGGNARTSLIVCCSPSPLNLLESLSTLRFGTQAKLLPNAPIVNRIRTPQELERLLVKAEAVIDKQSEIIESLQGASRRLKKRVRHHKRRLAGGGSGGVGAQGEGGAHNLLPEDNSDDDSDDDESSDSGMSSGAHSNRNHTHGGGGSGAGGGAGKAAANGGGDARQQRSPGSDAAHAAHVRSLQEEGVVLRTALERMREELSARGDEVKALSAALEKAEDKQGGVAQAEARAREAGAAAALRGALGHLRGTVCTICRTPPFEKIADIGGAIAVHEAACFVNADLQAAAKRAEERGAHLAREVSDLRLLVETLRSSSVRATRPSSAPRGSGGSGETGVSPEAARTIMDLQAKLSSLLHVHRQLLRKFAVVDAEAADMSDALQTRDARIAELSAANIAHSERAEAARMEAGEALHRERCEARAAREELAATVQALRLYYEGQRAGAAAARAAAAQAAVAKVGSGSPDGGLSSPLLGGRGSGGVSSSSPPVVLVSPVPGGGGGGGGLVEGQHHSSPAVLKPLRGGR